MDGEASLPELKQEVTVERDRRGVPRIKAASLEDLVTAQGYVLAQDRLWQMDLLRRTAAGELAEIFGSVAIESDRQYRIYGFTAAAEKCVTQMDAEMRSLLEAYARGVNRYVEERRDRLPMEFRILGYQPRPWKPSDSLLVGATLYRYLTSSWEAELNRAKITERLGSQLAREMYVSESPFDHILVGAAPAASPAVVRQKLAAKPPKAFPSMPPPALVASSAAPPITPHVAPGARELELWHAAVGLLEQTAHEIEFAFGSNNWVVSGEHTYSGKPMLANDTHLQLQVPSTWYIVHLTAPGWNVKGFALPGVPLVLIGHNERIAWGFTNVGADVQDLYVESFHPQRLAEYKVHGQWVPAEAREEVIRVKGEHEVKLLVMVTRHGPVVRREGRLGYALRWTALEPGGLWSGYPLLGKARNWDEFREIMRGVPGPAQNAVYADVDGNIGYLAAAKIPVRKSGRGEVPVPGDTDDYEWTGYIPFHELPSLFNPPGGVIATANARIVGPGYKWHLTNDWMAPYRTERIYQLLTGRKLLRPADFITFQTDVVSTPHRLLAAHLLAAFKNRQPRDARARELVGHLNRWNGRATSDSVPMAFLELTRRILRREILRDKLGNDIELYQWWRNELFLQNVLRNRPPHWLPKPFSAPGQNVNEAYDELLTWAADEAVREMERQSGSPKISEWEWGRFMQLDMTHPLGRTGLPRRHLSIAALRQHGSAHSVKQTGRSIGPAMRFVADLANFDNSLMNISMGQSGQYLSRHYRDQFPYWYEGRGMPSAFSDSAVEKAREHSLRLRPGGTPR